MQDVKERIERHRSFFEEGSTKDINFRMEQLKILRKAIVENEKEIMEALERDLGKSAFESYATEVGFVLDEIRYVLKHLRSWAKPKKVKTPLTHFLSTSRVYSEPYGVALIMSPWNYPFQLTIAPLTGAMAAGNCAVVKPSEYSFHTADIIEKIIRENFEEAYVSVVRGGREANQSLLDEEFEYIFFTGSAAVGKVVMEAASKHLTPVTLELGGKSPCIVDETADIDLAAKRIVWGKFLNTGQTCVAPDYLLVQRSVKEQLTARIKEYIHQFYGESPLDSPDYPKIINEKHFNRLLNLMKSGNVVLGGQFSTKTNRIAPTVIDEVTWDSPIMQEEIFGPLLPVIEFDSLGEVVSMVNKHPKPLALYLFTTNKEHEQYVLQNTSSGGGCINDTVVHMATPYMTFGGVGASGMGGYHGKASFDTFSNKKSILKKSNLIDVPLRYPPYQGRLKLLKRIMR